MSSEPRCESLHNEYPKYAVPNGMADKADKAKNVLLFELPALELNSTGTSIAGSNDQLDGSLDIDLREETGEQVYHTEPSNIQCQSDLTLRQNCNAENDTNVLEIVESQPPDALQSGNCCSNLITTGAYDIVVGKTIVGRLLKATAHQEERRNYIQANKHLLSQRTPKFSYSYGGLYHLNKYNRNSETNFYRPGVKTLGSSRAQSLSLVALPESTRTDHSNNSTRLFEKHERFCNAKGSEETSNPLGHTKMHASMERVGPVGFRNVQKRSVAASRIIQQGFKEQEELIKAYRNFVRGQKADSDCKPHTQTLTRTTPPFFSSRKTDFVRLPSVSPPTDPHFLPEARFSDNSLLPAVGKRSRQVPSRRYTLKDYTHLPKVDTRPVSLGPDLDSDDFKKRLAKKQRQLSYAQLLRMRAEKQREPKSALHPWSPTTNQDLASPTRRSVDQLTNTLMSLANSSSDKITAAAGHVESTSPNSLCQLFVNSRTPRTSKVKVGAFNRDLIKQEATRRRETMLQYSKHLREHVKISRLRKKNGKCDVQEKRKMSSIPNQNVAGSISNQLSNCENSNFDLQLVDLLKRYEEDRQVAEAIRKSLHLSCYA